MRILGSVEPSIQLRLVIAFALRASRLQELACNCANIAKGIRIIFKSANQDIVLDSQVGIPGLLQENELMQKKLVVGVTLLFPKKRTAHVGQSFALNFSQDTK